MGLDGSLIAFAAKKLGVSCAALFFDAAVQSTPAAERYAADVRELAEAACSQENPDHIWIAAKIRTKFRTEVVWLTGGKQLFGAKAREMVATGSKGDIGRIGFSGGALLLSWRRFRDASEGGRVEPADFVRPAAQVEALRRKESPETLKRCGEVGWARCVFLHGGSAADEAAWQGTERELATAVIKKLGISAP